MEGLCTFILNPKLGGTLETVKFSLWFLFWCLFINTFKGPRTTTRRRSLSGPAAAESSIRRASRGEARQSEGPLRSCCVSYGRAGRGGE